MYFSFRNNLSAKQNLLEYYVDHLSSVEGGGRESESFRADGDGGVVDGLDVNAMLV